MRWSVPTLCASSHGMAAPVGKEACSEAWHWLSGDWGLWSRAGARESECARFLWFVCAPLRVRHSTFCSVIHESVGEKGHASCWFLTHTDNEMNQRVATCPDGSSIIWQHRTRLMHVKGQAQFCIFAVVRLSKHCHDSRRVSTTSRHAAKQRRDGKGPLVSTSLAAQQAAARRDLDS